MLLNLFGFRARIVDVRATVIWQGSGSDQYGQEKYSNMGMQYDVQSRNDLKSSAE